MHFFLRSLSVCVSANRNAAVHFSHRRTYTPPNRNRTHKVGELAKQLHASLRKTDGIVCRRFARAHTVSGIYMSILVLFV